MSLRELEEKYAELHYENEGIFELVNYGVYTCDEVYDRIAENEAAMDEICREIKELKEEEEMRINAEMETSDEMFAREMERNMSRKHRKAAIKAKHHLAEIAPVQDCNTMPIHCNRNGAFIKHGWTGKSDWKHAERKANRAAARRELMGYTYEDIPETEIIETPSEIELKIARLERRIAEMEEERAWIQIGIDRIKSDIAELRKAATEDHVWSF